MAQTFREYRRQNPNTKNTKETFHSCQFRRGEIVGNVQKNGIVHAKNNRFELYLVTLITPEWVWAAPIKWHRIHSSKDKHESRMFLLGRKLRHQQAAAIRFESILADHTAEENDISF